MISPQATSDAAIAIRNKVWENDAAQIAGRLFYPELSGTGIVYTYNPRRFEQLATDTEAGEHFHVARS